MFRNAPSILKQIILWVGLIMDKQNNEVEKKMLVAVRLLRKERDGERTFLY